MRFCLVEYLGVSIVAISYTSLKPHTSTSQEGTKRRICFNGWSGLLKFSTRCASLSQFPFLNAEKNLIQWSLSLAAGIRNNSYYLATRTPPPPLPSRPTGPDTSPENSFWSPRCQCMGKLQGRREISFTEHDSGGFWKCKDNGRLRSTQSDLHVRWAAACSSRCLTVLWGRAGRQAAALDLLPPQPNSLLELLNLRVAVALFIGLLLLAPHVVLHQLNGGNEWLRNAEVSILLTLSRLKHNEEMTGSLRSDKGSSWIQY